MTVTRTTGNRRPAAARPRARRPLEGDALERISRARGKSLHRTHDNEPGPGSGAAKRSPGRAGNTTRLRELELNKHSEDWAALESSERSRRRLGETQAAAGTCRRKWSLACIYTRSMANLFAPGQPASRPLPRRQVEPPPPALSGSEAPRRGLGRRRGRQQGAPSRRTNAPESCPIYLRPHLERQTSGRLSGRQQFSGRRSSRASSRGVGGETKRPPIKSISQSELWAELKFYRN